jgi:acetyl esterase
MEGLHCDVPKKVIILFLEVIFMALDPYVKKVLDVLQNIEFSSLSVEQVRAVMDMGIDQQVKEDIKLVNDFIITYNSINLPCRLYEPYNASDGLIVYYHGGGFVFGNIELFDHVCRKAAKTSGCKVISVGYRLAPEYKFPAAVNDAYESYLWIMNHASTFGINKNKIVIAGDSAGANLATVTCLQCKDNHLPLPKLQILFYPVVAADLCSESLRQYGNGFFLTKASMLWFTQLYVASTDDLLNPYFFPILHDNLTGSPEAVIITAEHDPLCNQGEMYAVALQESNVDALCIQAEGMIHGFLNFSYLIPSAATLADMVWAIVGKKLR